MKCLGNAYRVLLTFIIVVIIVVTSQFMLESLGVNSFVILRIRNTLQNLQLFSLRQNCFKKFNILKFCFRRLNFESLHVKIVLIMNISNNCFNVFFYHDKCKIVIVLFPYFYQNFFFFKMTNSAQASYSLSEILGTRALQTPDFCGAYSICGCKLRYFGIGPEFKYELHVLFMCFI